MYDWIVIFSVQYIHFQSMIHQWSYCHDRVF